MCSHTPRFSYRVSKTAVSAHASAYGGWSGGAGMTGTAGGYWEGYTGYRGVLPTQHAARGGPRSRQRSGPRRPAGPEWVVCGPGRTGTGGGTAPGYHPSGPVGHPAGALPVPRTLGMPPPGQYRRELTSFYLKLVKTAKCHRNMSIRPPIVPILKTGLKSHLFKFSDFHFAQPSLTRN